jgi:N-methylhydantoinase A
MNDDARYSHYRLGFDIGGTFTDVVLCAPDGHTSVAKRLSHPEVITRAVVEGIRELIERDAVDVARIREVISGATTVVTNLIIERKGAATGLLTTEGFPDLIEIGREVRYDIYDIASRLPQPVIPRKWRCEVRERIDSKGEVVVPVDEDSVRRAVEYLRDDGVTSIAICFLHSFRHPQHEQRAREIALAVAPELFISLSSEVLAEIREFERTVATALNAYVRPQIGHYLQDLETDLAAIGLVSTVHLMQSNGGVISRDQAERMPLRMLESGPAAGALASAYVATLAGIDDVFSFDMGGTTAKACLISGGRPEITTEFETARVHRFKKGSGLPVKLPIIDLMEIGAGGGSIARVDAMGLLKVGPDSAGAQPGPACYARGGMEPTVTDAALILGYLDAHSALGGQVSLSLQRAQQAISDHIAKPLDMSVIEAASGIYRIVCENMASAVRVHAAEKGRDVRGYTLVAFGGAGPMHAREVARRLGCKRILVPPDAGVFSALGLLVAPTIYDAVRSRYARLVDVDWTQAEELFEQLACEATTALSSDAGSSDTLDFERSVDMRYVGQGFEITVPLPVRFDADIVARASASFHNCYEVLFGQHLNEVETEVLTWRLRASVLSTGDVTPVMGQMTPMLGDVRARRAYFPDHAAFQDTPVLRHGDVAIDSIAAGPALVEQAGCTVVIGPNERFHADQHSNLLIELLD